MDNNNNYSQSYSPELTLSIVMRKVYGRMFLGLIVTALTAMYVASSPALINLILGSRGVFFGLIIAELAMVWGIAGAINKMTTATSTLLFFLYAILNGVTLSIIFLAFSLGSIAYTFFITAGVFGAMSVYGYFTSNSLNSVGSYCIMALIGLIIASVVNIFMHSETLDWIISLAGVAIFIGLTAYDTQKIKLMAMNATMADTGKIAVMGALNLYLDFINLFLYLLRIFGKKN